VITADDLIAYSVFPEVKERATNLLDSDILEAVNEIKQKTGNDFNSTDYPTIPDEVKLAVKKLAQYYALINSDESGLKGYNSETLGGYSYTRSGGALAIKKPNINHLLGPYYKKPKFSMRVI
jgi:hypothetical protein